MQKFKEYIIYTLLIVCLFSLAWYEENKQQKEIIYPGFNFEGLKDSCKLNKNYQPTGKKLWGYI